MKTLDWTPPEGMGSLTVASWRTFYRRARDVYGITPADYRLLYVGQRGRCWICRKAKGIHPDDPNGRGTRRLGVDHNHVTGAVRGLLCTGGDKTCNRVIGWLDAAALRRAVDYLSKPPAYVLRVVEAQAHLADQAGTPLTRDEMDSLADQWLWP